MIHLWIIHVVHLNFYALKCIGKSFARFHYNQVGLLFQLLIKLFVLKLLSPRHKDDQIRWSRFRDISGHDNGVNNP